VLAITLLSVALVAGLGAAGGYGLGMVVDAVRAAWPEAVPELASDKAAPPEPIDLSGPADTCLPESLDVRLSADATTITAGDPVTFSVRVRNVGLAPCLVDGSDASRSVTITDASGKERVWSSGDCAEGERMLLLGPGDGWAQDVRWSFVRTVKGCEGGQPAVEPGDYRAKVTLDDVPGARSNVINFTVAAPAAPTPSDEPSSEEPSDEPAGAKGSDGKGNGKGAGKPDETGEEKPDRETATTPQT
jgi:hypothetical protein